MFENSSCFAVLPASDLARCRSFWHDTFGIDPVDDGFEEGLAEMYEIGGTRVLIYETQFAGTAQNTALGIDSDDFDRDMADLKAKGVRFNEYDLPGVTTVDGVVEMDGTRTAWFNDSEGNIIALGERA
ncbi:VOC family protein [Aeromicrobium sp.]|uniref:VOC family protein n=1 Tax=Aeromicrobium sp. TaxID=1871063 RepID=UPI003C3200DB